MEGVGRTLSDAWLGPARRWADTFAVCARAITPPCMGVPSQDSRRHVGQRLRELNSQGKDHEKPGANRGTWQNGGQ